MFSTTLQDTINKYAPLKSIKISHRKIINQPWMTKGLLKSSKKLNKMYSNAIKVSKTDVIYKQCVTYRNLLDKIKKTSKFQHHRQILQEYKYDMKNTWRTLNNIIGRSNDRSTMTFSTFTMNDEKVSDPTKIVNGFCDYFTNIGPKLANQIPTSEHDSLHYLHKKRQHNPSTFFMIPTHPTEILDILKKLKPNNSSGHDNVSTKLLKSLDTSISLPLSILANASMQTGIVPNTLKIAKVVPIYKSKKHDEFANYRPIALFSSLSKVLEKLVHHRLYTFMENHNILNNNQYGFRQKFTTTDAITKFVSDITQSLDTKDSTLAVYLDLSKAFDTLNHKILLTKLEFYGIRGLPLDWFNSYLSQRKQYVEYIKFRSETRQVECGVPQGSVLGPLLFILYINDLPDAIENARSIIFADDTTIYISGRNIESIYRTMNRELNVVVDWYRANKLSLNETKTNLMLFTNSSNPVVNIEIIINNIEVKNLPHTKFLGIHIDNKLKWNEHTRVVNQKISRAYYALTKAKYYLPKSHLKMIYHSIIYPHLIYGIPVWGAAHATHKTTLKITQKKIIRTINGSKYDAHSEPIFKALDILKLDDIYRLYAAQFVYKFFTFTLPEPLKPLFTLVTDTHSYMTRHSTVNKLCLWRCRLTTTTQSIINNGPKIWNSLPEHIYLNTHNANAFVRRQVFSKNVKKYILNDYEE